MDQPYLPGPGPVLNVLLPLDGRKHVFVSFDVDQPMQAVVTSETIYQTYLVLGHTSSNVARDADIQRTVWTVGHDVNPVGGHAAQPITRMVKKSWVAGPS